MTASAYCPRCAVSVPVAELLDGEACPRCKLVIPASSCLWRVGIDCLGAAWTWEGYAITSTDATMHALAWLQDELREHHGYEAPPKMRVTEALQVGV